jgi:toxin YoeB
MIYELILSDEAKAHLVEWRMSGQKKTLKKIADLFMELQKHPRTGTGQVEQLKGELFGKWNRRITKGDRLIYTIEDEIVVVTIVSMKGHYGDK